MASRKLAFTLAILAVASMPLSAFAGETPRGLFIKMKCAPCHGEDGVGNTPAGKQKGVPNLRTETVQQLTDNDLLKPVVQGHAGIPAMQAKIPIENRQLLVSYLRGLADKKK